MPESALNRVAELEASLLDAVAADDAEEMTRCVRARDAMIRSVAPTLDAPQLQALARQDAAFRARMTDLRDRVSDEIDGLRLGRRASRAYAETASA